MSELMSSQGPDYVKHVVMWRLKDQAEGNSKRHNATRAKHLLESLLQKISNIMSLEVGLGLNASLGGFDLVLTAAFSDLQALQVFQQHSAYQEVTDFLTKVSETHHTVDYDGRIHPSDRLLALIRDEQTLVMPNAYDALSAKLIEKAGFPAVQCSGYSMTVAAGLASESLLSRDYNLQMTRQIVASVTVPVMADGEDGYGGPEQVAQTVWAFMEAGAAGINLEDQVLDRETSVRVIDQQAMIDKLRCAREAADKFGPAPLVINARTDLLRAGPDHERQLRKAAQRANTYLDNGADLVFIPYVTTLRDAAFLKKEIAGPLSIAAGLTYNIENFSVNDLRNLGVARVSLPTFAISAALHRMKQSLESLRRTGRFDSLE